MKKYLFFAGALLVLSGAGLSVYLHENRSEVPVREVGIPVLSIGMADGGYSTTSIIIRKNETVAFKNTSNRERWPASDLHPTHEIYSDFDPQAPVYPGETWAFRFERCGTWRFHDHLAPNIRGVITVACDSQVPQQ